jgi:hypothetical protein
MTAAEKRSGMAFPRIKVAPHAAMRRGTAWYNAPDVLLPIRYRACAHLQPKLPMGICVFCFGKYDERLSFLCECSHDLREYGPTCADHAVPTTGNRRKNHAMACAA